MPFCGYVYVGIGRILRQWNLLEEAYRYTKKGVALCRGWNVAEILALSYVELAYIALALGYDEESRESIQEAFQIMSTFSPFGTRVAAAHQAKLNLAQDDSDAAKRWAEASDLTVDGDYVHHLDTEYLALVRVFIDQKQFDQAQDLARRICQIAQDIEKKQSELAGLILLALISSNQGETSQALAHLKMALSIAEPEGYIRTFVDEGPPMAKLLYEALSQKIRPDYVRRLLAAFPSPDPAQTERHQNQSSEFDWVEPLSKRELEVLELIAEGLTNQEIGARLYLSPNTVKVHNRTIFSKLGVNSRTQAVARARTMGLLKAI